jgi:hypothetical protein
MILLKKNHADEQYLAAAYANCPRPSSSCRNACPTSGATMNSATPLATTSAVNGHFKASLPLRNYT